MAGGASHSYSVSHELEPHQRQLPLCFIERQTLTTLLCSSCSRNGFNRDLHEQDCLFSIEQK